MILSNSPAVRDLTLSLPACDLEDCRIKGITWEYTFPALETLDIRTYNTDNNALEDFLLRHPKITTLTWNVDSDDGFIFPENSLPELRALSIEKLSEANVNHLASCKGLEQLRITSCWDQEALLRIARLKSLRYLELKEDVGFWRESFKEPGEEDDTYDKYDGEEDEDDNDNEEEDKKRAADALEAKTGYRTHPAVIGGLLERMPGLHEFAIDLSTGNTWYQNKERVWGHYRPMDVRDLVSTPSMKPFPELTEVRFPCLVSCQSKPRSAPYD